MSANSDSTVHGNIVQRLYQLAPHEGYTQSLLADVRFMRSNRPLKNTAVLYEPSIVIICQGRKRGYLGNSVYLYDAQHYLVLSVPLPFTSARLIHEADLKTKIADGILLRNQNVPARI